MAGEDASYLRWIREHPCASCGAMQGIQAHHHTGAGMGLRASDYEAMPLCMTCHGDFHEARGRFRDWDHAKRTEWQDELVAKFYRIWSNKEAF